MKTTKHVAPALTALVALLCLIIPAFAQDADALRGKVQTDLNLTANTIRTVDTDAIDSATKVSVMNGLGDVHKKLEAALAELNATTPPPDATKIAEIEKEVAAVETSMRSWLKAADGLDTTPPKPASTPTDKVKAAEERAKAAEDRAVEAEKQLREALKRLDALETAAKAAPKAGADPAAAHAVLAASASAPDSIAALKAEVATVTTDIGETVVEARLKEYDLEVLRRAVERLRAKMADLKTFVEAGKSVSRIAARTK